MTSCVDLRPICEARRWRWRYDDPSITGRTDDAAWHVEVLCRNGLIYPFGDDDLLMCVEGHPKMPSRIRTLGPSIRPHQGSVVFRFPARLLHNVADVLKPKRLSGRFATESDRERLAKYAFQGGQNVP